MPTRRPTYAQQVQRLIARTERSLQERFVAAVKEIRDERTLKQLAELMEQGRINEALSHVESAVGRFGSAVNEVYVIGGQTSAGMLTDVLNVTIDFNQVNDRAVNFMRGERLRLIREFTDEQRRATRLALTDGIERGLNPIAQARNFRASIGLTERQMRAVNNYRTLLTEGRTGAIARELRDRRFDSTVARAVAGEQPLTSAQIERMVQRYHDRMLAYRAKTIARTEALRAAHTGAYEGIQQAVDEGLVQREEIERQWLTANDEKTRGSHAAMHRQIQGLDTPFVSGDGVELMYPGDPSAPAEEVINCRCVVTVRLRRQTARAA